MQRRRDKRSRRKFTPYRPAVGYKHRGPKWWVRGWVVSAERGREEGVFGPYDTEMEATDFALVKCIGGFEIKQLPTTNETRAVHMFRMDRLDEGASLSEAFKDFRHRGEDINI